MKASRIISTVLAVSLISLVAMAADPVVSNVQLQQLTDGSGILQVSYDLADSDNDTCAVALQLSIDAGVTWNFPALNVSGDAGDLVVPGTGKTIYCDLGSLPVPIVESQMAAKVVASDTGVEFKSHSPEHAAVINLAAVDWSDQQNFDKFSRADVLIITGSDLWDGANHAHLPIVQELKTRNPDLVIVGYVSGFSAKLYAATPNTSPFWHDWYVRTEPYWVWTTEGDTAQTWPGNVVIDITEPACRTAMIETIMEHQNNSLNQLDGLYWDYFNNSLWSYSGVDMNGEIDMDNDGVGHLVDQDEMQAYREAQVELIQAMRDSMGGDFLQIFNGQRAYGDSTFAGLADGVMYEIFPTLFFPDPDMGHALDPSYVNNLFNVRTWLRQSERGPFVLMSNTWENRFIDLNQEIFVIQTGNQFRAIALLMDGYACWNTHDGDTFSYTYGWPEVDINLGQPLAAATFEGNFIRRQFQFGQVEIEMGSGRYPNAFDYRIWCLGQLVEELSIPFHHP